MFIYQKSLFLLTYKYNLYRSFIYILVYIINFFIPIYKIIGVYYNLLDNLIYNIFM